ncbi:MAG: ABC-F family ATP-binding cassette domain-containing protein, partial [Bacteroidia bacterium]|nr:ABC-F family ATP-binding cassette domain-containing protein [Bacteroidia bacterium]
MISLNKVGVYFGGQTLFDDVSFMINQGDRIGLVGKNGAGKSTLLRLIAEEDKPNSGKIDKAKEVTIGYLTQDLDFEDTGTVLEEAESVFKEIKSIEHELEEIKSTLETTDDHESDAYMEKLNRLHDLENRFVHLDGYNYKQEIGKVLVGLGFDKNEFGNHTSTFSGGWRMRIELAKILLQKPDVLLLDEPTNHLDIESIMWLEKWLKNYTGAVVLVSHDRTFLDIVCNRTIEIMGGRINDYKASYTKFMVLREER